MSAEYLVEFDEVAETFKDVDYENETIEEILSQYELVGFYEKDKFIKF